MRSNNHPVAVVAFLSAILFLVTACGPSTEGSEGSQGGNLESLTVAVVSQPWPSLGPPPAKQSAAFVLNYMNAIYGELFTRSPDGEVVGSLATGYEYSPDGKTLTISIRPEVKFHDGTPFTADAVAAHFERSLDPENACSCIGSFTAVQSVTAEGDDVVLHLSGPDYSLPQQIVAQAPNWVPSPTAYEEMGAGDFGQKPVGAGPFKVVSNTASSQLVLERNPDYWDSPRPYLEKLTFVNADNDQTAYANLKAGSAQLALGITEPQLLTESKAEFQQVSQPGVVVHTVELNSTDPPFDNPKARQALAYATDPAQILELVSPGYGVVSESPTGPGGLLSQLEVPGSRGHDLEKAKALVSEIGGLSFTFTYITTTDIYTTGAQALARQWREAGIDVTLDPVPLTTYGEKLQARSWDSLFTVVGGVTPMTGSSSALPSKYGLEGIQTCCNDPTLAGMITQLAETPLDSPDRETLAGEIYKYISDEQYTITLFSLPAVSIATKSLVGLEPAPNGTAGKEIIPLTQLR